MGPDENDESRFRCNRFVKNLRCRYRLQEKTEPRWKGGAVQCSLIREISFSEMKCDVARAARGNICLKYFLIRRRFIVSALHQFASKKAQEEQEDMSPGVCR
jgi:hypothetical protein